VKFIAKEVLNFSSVVHTALKVAEKKAPSILTLSYTAIQVEVDADEQGKSFWGD